MPVMARCRECGKQYRMRDELAGKVLPCKECGADFRVPRAGKPQPGRPKSGAAARPPRSPQARPKPKKNDFFENDDDSPGGGSALIWIIGGVSAVVVLAGVLIAVFAFRGNGDEEKKDKPDDSEKLAQNDEQNDEDREPPDNAGRNRRNNRNVIPPRNNNRNRQNNNRNNRNANKQPGGLQPPPRRVNLPPQIGNNQPNNGKGLPGGIIPPEKKKQKPVFGDSNAAGWRVAVDPPAQQVEFTNRDKKPIIAPGGTRADPLFPTTTSAFVALGSNRDVKSIRQVWDLRTKTKVGRIGGIKLFFSKGKLSPDGKHFAAMSKETKGIWLWDVAAEKQLGTLPLDEKTASRLKLPVLEFAGPNRLVAAGRGTPLWVWSIPDGKPERSLELPKGYETESLGFSHGGRYLTVYKREGFGKRSAIHAYDLTTGKEAGQLLMPKDIGLMHCRGTAFSPDGTELAALFEFTTKNRLFVWDVKTGRQLVHHSFRRASKHYKGPAVQWFPDKSKWLVYGNDVIDRKAGGPVWSVPKQPGASSGSPARLLGGDRIALFGSERGVSALAALEVPEDQLAKGAQVIKAGGTTSDVGLPPLRAAEYVGSRTIAVNGVAGRWSVQPDAANDPAGETLTGSMNLDSSFGKVMGALLARRDVAQALVVSHAAGRFGRLPDGDGKTPLVRLDRYDLVNRKLVDSLSLTYPADLLAFSPSGKRALLRYKKGEDRVDCWSLEEKKPVIGWRPYSKERFSHYKKVNAAVFVDDDHVLTLNGRNKLVLWKLPDCTAVYVMENVSKPGLSPNGRYLTVAAGNSFRMFDARTGDAVGDVTFSGTPQAAAFHPNGERFAAVYTDAEGTKLGVWDLTTGKSSGSFPLRTSARSVHWCGDGYGRLELRPGRGNSRAAVARRKALVPFGATAGHADRGEFA